ncbi:high-affinity branched-chain amino acid ABC transporter permease LivM [Aurantimonas sp. MSK8Z-1]|uniref:high-affinity branched-chain amino acid ABC transporter permease LivM n=1 Tax=Mangrovibrevibacter kandeliae TaxID=2968473 RepID=UPI002117CC97|nr:high-affinity branched-chain amino acid ABC transporter permease LivM [Aurantimonas sp. MSK8Z-1]MCW4113969.1 high-affinity branched-chain amino acid ABC transporter permease LivM [Aurantimonas sp. MSK8Z-1]
MSAIDPTAVEARPEGAQLKNEELRDTARGEPPFAPEPILESRLQRSLREAALTAAVVAGLTLFFFAFRTDIGIGGLDLILQWPLWFVWVAIAFAARFLLSYFVYVPGRKLGDIVKRDKTATSPGAAAGARWLGRAVAVVMLLIAATFPFLIETLLPSQDRYLIDLAILILTYVMLGWGLNIVVGLAGLLDLGYVAFYAVGAYSFALLATNFDLGFWVCLPMAGLFAAGWGIVLGFPVLRLRGDYLAIVTLAFGEIIRVILINWGHITGGPNGVLGIPKPTLFGLDFGRGEGSFSDFFGIPYSSIHRFIFLYYIILLLALLTNFVTLRLRKLPIGRAWEALREDEIACRALGLNTTNVKLTAFATGAMFGGFAGSFFATRQGFISPESFTFIESAIILAIVVLGGLGSQLGVVFASVVMIGGIELLRHLTILQAVFGSDFDPTQYRMLIFGLAMVGIMVWKPRGLISSRSPSAIYKEKKVIGADLVAQGEGH